jgi:hypothetical protein
MPNKNQISSLDEARASLSAALNFLFAFWRHILFSICAGAFLGFAVWFFFGAYTAEYVLLNTNNTFDIVSYKSLQKSLPSLASQYLEKENDSGPYKTLLTEMQDEVWWQKNVIPTYAISKNDARELAGISKEYESASTTIINLTISTTAATKEEASLKAIRVSNFLRNSGAYLQVKNLINNYELLTSSSVADINQKISAAKLEINYQKDRLKSLENLHRRFPDASKITGQVIDPKDSGAKYLPIVTQIIAVNKDIQQLEESLLRYRSRLSQLMLAKEFLDQANNITGQNFYGLDLTKKLLEIENDLRKKNRDNDENLREFLDTLHFQLISIEMRYTRALESNVTPSIRKKGALKSLLTSLLLTLLLLLVYLWLKEFNPFFKVKGTPS